MSQLCVLKKIRNTVLNYTVHNLSYPLVSRNKSESKLLYIAFLHNHGILRKKEAQNRDYALLLFPMTSRVLYSTQYHRQHCTHHAFVQFGALYMHNHDDKYPARPGFKPGTSRLQAPVDTNEPLWTASRNKSKR